MIPFRLDYVIEKVINKPVSQEQIFFEKVFGAKVAKREAQAYFERLLTHKWYISEKLGRDVGMYVAALDFATNIEPLPTKRQIRRNFSSKINRGMRFGLTA